MEMTPQDNFRYGFLMSCAQQGLTPDQVREVVKTASEHLRKEANVGRSLAALWAKLPLAIAGYGLMGSAGVGALGGHALAKATEDELDPEEVRRQELLATYRQQAERARRNASRIRYRQPRRPPAEPQLF